jgi:hypothetical protein
MDINKAYKTYVAVKLHFDSDYDIFKYRGSVKAEIPKKREIAFKKLCNEIQNINFIQYLVANVVEGNAYCGVYDIDTGIRNYTNWKKRIDSLTYQFKMDLDVIDKCMARKGLTIEEVLNYNGEHTWIYKLYSGKSISIETVVILNGIYNFVDTYYNKDDFLLNSFCILISKYYPFLNIDINLYRQIVDSLLGEHYGIRYSVA